MQTTVVYIIRTRSTYVYTVCIYIRNIHGYACVCVAYIGQPEP